MLDRRLRDNKIAPIQHTCLTLLSTSVLNGCNFIAPLAGIQQFLIIALFIPFLKHWHLTHKKSSRERQFFDSLHIIVLGTTKCQKEAADDWTHKGIEI